MEPILLVHGAWHGAWCWNKLTPELESRGRQVVTIDLPGAGDDSTPPGSVTMDVYVETILAALRALGRPATVVAHSFGGMPMTAAAELAPDLFGRLVYLAAHLPISGESTMTMMGRLAGHGPAAPEPTPTADGTALVIDERAILAMYSGCSDDDIAVARARLTPLPLRVGATPVVTTTERAGRVPRTYIECTTDNAFSIKKQRQLIAAAQPIDVVSIDSGHSPFYAVPDRLADVLCEL